MNASNLKKFPLEVGVIHFVGIGGIGMSGIAEIMHNLGYLVQGSDLVEGANVARLKSIGIRVTVGHAEQNLGSAEVVVISSAVNIDNPEIVAARRRLIPVVRRAEMLGELMRLRQSIAVGGTHGKTTTTSMIASLLDDAKLDPTVINGGIINAWGSNARLGQGDWMVVEADESDGTFVKLPSTIAVVTNINLEHMDHYGSFDALRRAFDAFVENIPFYGFAILCIDDSEVQSLISRVSDRKIITYGVNSQAEIRVTNMRTTLEGSYFDVDVLGRTCKRKTHLTNLFLPMHGGHNVQNALSVIGVANELGISDDIVAKSLAEFSGVKRRFTKTGEVDGITIIDDYAHHPVEILAVLKAARLLASKGQIIAVIQPHRYTRLRDLLGEFCTCFYDADTVIVAPVHAAGEKPIEGIHRDALVDGLRHHGHRAVQALKTPEDLPGIIDKLAERGDLVLCMGAGTITQWANVLPEKLRQLRYGHKEAANDVG